MILDALIVILNQTTRIIDLSQTELPAGHRLVDFYAATVVVDPTAATEHRDGLLDQLTAWPSESRGPDAGMSLNDAMSVLGSADSVFRLFALGHTLDIWRVVLPQDLGNTYGSQTVEPDHLNRIMDTAQLARLVSMGALTVADFNPRRNRPRSHTRPR